MAATQTARLGEPTGRLAATKDRVGDTVTDIADSYAAYDSASQSYVDGLTGEPTNYDRLNQGINRAVQVIGGAVITIAIIALVVNEVLTTDAINSSTGPFSGVIDDLGTTGVAAMGLLIIALLVAAAGVILRMMGGGNGGF